MDERVIDYINGLFEVGGAILCWINVKKLLEDRRVLGVYWPVQAFFAAWGLWNLFYYPSLDQWASFAGGVFLVAGNLTWVILAIRYSRRQGELGHVRIPGPERENGHGTEASIGQTTEAAEDE